MEVFEYDDKKLSFFWLLFFSSWLYWWWLSYWISQCVCVSLCIYAKTWDRKEEEQSTQSIFIWEASQVYEVSLVLQNWSWLVEILGELWFFVCRWTCSCELDAKKNPNLLFLLQFILSPILYVSGCPFRRIRMWNIVDGRWLAQIVAHLKAKAISALGQSWDIK